MKSSTSILLLDCNRPISSKSKVKSANPKRQVKVVVKYKLNQAFWLDNDPDNTCDNTAHCYPAESGEQVTQLSDDRHFFDTGQSRQSTNQKTNACSNFTVTNEPPYEKRYAKSSPGFSIHRELAYSLLNEHDG